MIQKTHLAREISFVLFDHCIVDKETDKIIKVENETSIKCQGFMIPQTPSVASTPQKMEPLLNNKLNHIADIKRKEITFQLQQKKQALAAFQT